MWFIPKGKNVSKIINIINYLMKNTKLWFITISIYFLTSHNFECCYNIYYYDYTALISKNIVSYQPRNVSASKISNLFAGLKYKDLLDTNKSIITFTVFLIILK